MSDVNSRSLAAASSWCNNDFKFNKLSYTWTIGNFSYRREETITSSTFSSPADENTKWKLELHPSVGPFRKPYVSLYLVLADSNRRGVRAKFKFSIVGQTDTVFNSEILDFSPNNTPGIRTFGDKFGKESLVERETLLDEKNGLLPNDALTIQCDVHVLEDTVVTTGQQSQVSVPECQLSSDFAQLLHSQDFSDCILVAGGKQFKVHKAVLCARSPVFAAMFKHQMKEVQKDRIQITDISPDAMEELLQFIYTGSAPKLEQMVMDLLAAADKYQLERLKAVCENALSITPENACEILVLSHLHSANQLKTQAIQCINTHVDTVVNTRGWEQLEKHHPKLITEVFKAKNSNM